MQYESLKRMVFVAAVAAGGCERGGESTVEPGGANQAGVTSDAGQAGAATRLQALVPWPDLDTEAKPVAGGENDAAVIVALESYSFVPAVPGATTNGLAWQRYFTQTLKVPVDKVRVLTNTEATKEEIETALDRAAKQAAAGGRVWFVFIGHGAPSRTGQDGLLLGSDVQQTTDSLEARSVRRSELLARLEQSAAQPVVVLDACFSGQTAGQEPLCEGCQPVLLAEFQAPKNAIVLSAAKADQVAGALPGRAQPAFSYLVLGALRGWADGDGGGTITADEVLAYTNQALGAVIKGRVQTPELIGDGTAVLVTSAGEQGPNLAEIQRALTSGGAARFNGDGIVLPELPTLTLRDVGRDELATEVDLASIDIEKEKQIEAQHLALEQAKAKLAEARAAAKDDPTGAKQEKAWCELAALGDPNPYRVEAEKGCAEIRSYVEQRKRLIAAMERDWEEKVRPFLDLQHRSAEDKRKVMQAFVDAYGVLAEQRPIQAASYWLEHGELLHGFAAAKLSNEVSDRTPVDESVSDEPFVEGVRLSEVTATYEYPSDLARRIIRAHLGEVRACRREAVELDPRAGGVLAVSLTVGMDGNAENVLTTSSRLPHQTITCVDRVVEGMKLVKPDSGSSETKLYFKIEFERGG